jgi:diguanylate cyclase (GGDEF)-like protein
LTNRDPRTRAANARLLALYAAMLGSRATWAVEKIGLLAALGLAILLLLHPVIHIRGIISTGGILGVGVLFAGGLPGLISHQRIRQRRTGTEEDSSSDDEDTLAAAAELKELLEKAEAALARTRRNDGGLAVLLVDLNQFQHVNDRFGRRFGDKVLQVVEERLKSNIRSEDTVARLGGDGFMILQAESAQPGGARSLAVRLKASLAEPYEIGNLRAVCRARIGVAVAPVDGAEWETLLARADSALRRAKAEDLEGVCFSDTEMDADFRKRCKVESDLRRALESRSLQLAFQPLLRSADQEQIGFEALLRWPAGWEQQSPAVFIPVAEECGLMVPIGAWVLETACKWAAAWTKPLKLSVNLSPFQFRNSEIVTVVAHALEKTGLDPRRLELEVTESLWAQDAEDALDQLAQLQAMGVSIVLDDFGAGSSGLTCLSKFPFDAVKIDRSIVAQMDRDPIADAIVKTIVAMGRTRRIAVTAEGVETRAQADALIAAGCDRVQGYLYGRPLSATSPIF